MKELGSTRGVTQDDTEGYKMKRLRWRKESNRVKENEREEMFSIVIAWSIEIVKKIMIKMNGGGTK